MNARWYIVEYPAGGYDIACVDCWDQAQAAFALETLIAAYDRQAAVDRANGRVPSADDDWMARACGNLRWKIARNLTVKLAQARRDREAGEPS